MIIAYFVTRINITFRHKIGRKSWKSSAVFGVAHAAAHRRFNKVGDLPPTVKIIRRPAGTTCSGTPGSRSVLVAGWR